MHNSGIKIKQTSSRAASEARGTSGRPQHKGKASSTNKGRGGKMAR